MFSLLILLLLILSVMPNLYDFRHICETIVNQQYHQLNLQSMFFLRNTRELVIVESDQVYIIQNVNTRQTLNRIHLPTQSGGLWHENERLFWSATELKEQKMNVINQFGLAGQRVNVFITEEQVLYYSFNSDRNLIRYEAQPVIPAVVITDAECKGYFIHRYSDDGEIGIKDMWMAFKLSRNQFEGLLPIRFEKFLYQLIVSSADRFTVDTATDEYLVLYPSQMNRKGTIKKLPMGFFIFPNIYLFDAQEGYVHVFKYTDLVELYYEANPVTIPKTTYRLNEFLNCSNFGGQEPENYAAKPEQNRSPKGHGKQILLALGTGLVLAAVAAVVVVLVKKRSIITTRKAGSKNVCSKNQIKAPPVKMTTNGSSESNTQKSKGFLVSKSSYNS